MPSHVKNGPIQLVALADVIAERVSNGYSNLSRRFDKQVDVPEDRRFVGFDGYKKAMDCLRPGDVVILATPPVFRWVHFKYAIDKGPERVHGEAGVGRRADVGEDVQAGQGIGQARTRRWASA